MDENTWDADRWGGGSNCKLLKTKQSKKQRDYARDDGWEVQRAAAGRHASFVNGRQGKELTGLPDILWYIIPVGYLLSRSLWFRLGTVGEKIGPTGPGIRGVESVLIARD